MRLHICTRVHYNYSVNVYKTKNTFCGTWNLPHSQVHYERQCHVSMVLFLLPVWNLTVGTVQMVNLRHRTKFRGDRSNRCGDIAIFRYSKMDLWCACLNHPRSAFGGLYHCAKFGWNRYSTFDDMQVLIFCRLGLKTSIHAPKIGIVPEKVDESSPK